MRLVADYMPNVPALIAWEAIVLGGSCVYDALRTIKRGIADPKDLSRAADPADTKGVSCGPKAQVSVRIN